jgi:hypothetical protein
MKKLFFHGKPIEEVDSFSININRTKDDVAIVLDDQEIRRLERSEQGE